MVLEGLLIVDPLDGEFTGDLEIEEGKIARIKKKYYHNIKGILMPGFVDPHIHGIMGADTMNCEFEKMEEYLYSQGVTSFLATTVSTSFENVKKILHRAENYIASKLNTSMKGLHLEGPYISEEKRGAHSRKYLKSPSEKEVNELSFPVKIITFAPELENIDLLFEKEFVLSAGHSNASFEEFTRVYKKGVRRITHFPNALRPLHHREIGITGAGLLLEDVKLELICDGVHLSKEMIQLVYKVKGARNIVLVTDSISATGVRDGVVFLGDLLVRVKNGVPRLEDGTLAGSTLMFSEAVKNFVKFTKATLKEVALVSSYNSCIELGMKEVGRIKEGGTADLVMLNQNLDPVLTLKGGEIVYKKIN
ncbi:N-acetylglucosamine-6-phosphate deacetylase [Thermotoga sp. KOL6]|uniref:N-acetylglucosamine-6-phosphate deacetylase n=1 Tax=Thermotoga sp. KOL6 TaxID=126741 RepID=UPI000C77DD08|nr:N-acetylglucosamine-6-phosphate deacetylase [Thermotoga sp. KOL6]PLV58396.1 N-acetylglucosamine-6-phosphate deacetylase [Thermotoga sp. KOL6]